MNIISLTKTATWSICSAAHRLNTRDNRQLIYGERRGGREEVLLSAAAPHTAPDPHSSQSTGLSNRIGRWEVKILLPPPHYLCIFIQLFLSWRGIIPLRASEIWGLGRDGVTRDRPKQGKLQWSKHGERCFLTAGKLKWL